MFFTLTPLFSKNGYDIFKCTDCCFGQVNVTAEDIANFYDREYLSDRRHTSARRRTPQLAGPEILA
jgi:hypothetical protein